ncbi:brachyurin-like [Armigeres subalbatus]|uniref:brachyurin-like n=1 Tax=Armigeres subalbatus TaxID=124917 RepID=UPI002ED35E83
MKSFSFLITGWAVISAEWIYIDWSKVRPIHAFDRYWVHLPSRLQYLRQSVSASRITNRQEALPGQFPYQAALVVNFTDGIGMCGGSILTQKFILTAAHCVYDALGGTAIMGAHNIRLTEPTQQRISFDADDINMHSGYTYISPHNDIATIRLNDLMIFNDRVVPIKLPTAADIRTFTYFTGTVSGFGQTSNDTSEVLMFLRKPTITNMECFRYWGNWVDHRNICLSGAGGPASCVGDSGGPLTVKVGAIVQVGIVSFGTPGLCCIGSPSVYVRVSHYRKWIIRNSDL